MESLSLEVVFMLLTIVGSSVSINDGTMIDDKVTVVIRSHLLSLQSPLLMTAPDSSAGHYTTLHSKLVDLLTITNQPKVCLHSQQ